MFDFDSYIRLLREDPKDDRIAGRYRPTCHRGCIAAVSRYFLQPIPTAKRMPYGKRHRKRVIISVEQRF